ncbi:MAG: LptA/OstA family protein, partial [Alphaproteobacteria bacterium]
MENKIHIRHCEERNATKQSSFSDSYWIAASAFGLLAMTIVVTALASPALAQTTNSSQPLEITADGSLEWNRNEKLFIARNNALAKQGDTAIKAETLTAHYRDGEKGGMDIHHVNADGKVELRSKDSLATGQKADYDLDKAFAVMTGDNLKMTSPDQTVTAQDRFEYHVNEGKLLAIGGAKAIRKNIKGETNTLEADTISAILKDDAKGQRKLETLEAIGNVTITTPTEKVMGQRGIYHAATNKATMTGGVTLHRGPNILQGERAEVDMTTNTSQLFGGPASTTGSG